MNVIEFQEFCRLAGIPTNTFSVYLKRGKIVAEKIIGEGKGRRVLIDTDNPLNKSFILSKQTVTAKKEILQSSASVDEQLGKISDDNSNNNGHEEGKESEEKPSNNHYQIDLQLKKAELRLRNQKQQVNKIIIEKAEGRLVPIDVVGRLTAEVIHRYKSTMVQQMDQLIRDYFNANQIESKQLTEALSKLVDIANEASHRAVTESKIAMQNSVTDSLSLNK
jgi:hypothetical protein